jgi:hypothetical protein
LAERGAAKRVERVTGLAQGCARLRDPTLAAQPLAMSEQEPGALEGPAAEVGAQCLLEAFGGASTGMSLACSLWMTGVQNDASAKPP